MEELLRIIAAYTPKMGKTVILIEPGDTWGRTSGGLV